MSNEIHTPEIELDNNVRMISKTPNKNKGTPLRIVTNQEWPSILLTPKRHLDKSDSIISQKRNRAPQISLDQTKTMYNRAENWARLCQDWEAGLTLGPDPVELEILQPDLHKDDMCEEKSCEKMMTLKQIEDVESHKLENALGISFLEQDHTMQPDLPNDAMREETENLLHSMDVELFYDDGNEIINFLNCSRYYNHISFRQYRCVRVLDERGCSKVFEAINKEDDQRYAVKVMYYSEPSSKKMVEDEIKIMKVMSATNRSIKVIDSRISKNGAVIVMEKAIFDLKQFFTNEGPNLEPITILHYWTQMLLCVKEMHDRRISHLDLKLRNFVITELGEVKLINFGIRRELAPDTSIICENDGCGTIVFMSPELLREERIVAPEKCDVWAMGVVLYCLLFDTTPVFVSKERVLAVPEDPEQFKHYMLYTNYDIYYPRESNISPFFHELLAMTLARPVDERASVDELIEKINSHF